MPCYMGANGKPTNDENAAAVDPKTGNALDNPPRNIWINETALTTALHTSYFAESVATFAIVMGFAMLLSGIGFLVLTRGVLREPAEATAAAKATAPRQQAITA